MNRILTHYILLALLFFPTHLVWAIRAPDIEEDPLPEGITSTKVSGELSYAMGVLKSADFSPQEFNSIPAAGNFDDILLQLATGYIVQNQSEILGPIALEDIVSSYKVTIPAKSLNPSLLTHFEWIQKYRGKEIIGANLCVDIKLLPVKTQFVPHIISIQKQLVDPGALDKLPEITELEKTKFKNEALIRLGISLDESVSNEKVVIAWYDQNWHTLYQFDVKAPDQDYSYTVWVDPKNPDEIMAKKNIYYVRNNIPTSNRIFGQAQGRGILFDPLNTTNLNMLNLIDLEVMLNGTTLQHTNSNGDFVFPNITSGQLQAMLRGRWADVIPYSGARLTFTGTATPQIASNILFNSSGNQEFSTSQVTAYYHTEYVHNKLATILPSIFVNWQLSVSVNRTDFPCNASFSSFGTFQLNFAASYFSCPNMAYDTVVYHEYGHFADYRAGDITHGALSEGWGDIVASYVSEQPIIGEGFIGTGTWIRRVDNNFQYPFVLNAWEAAGFVATHVLGQAWSGLGWDLRNAFINRYGIQQGKQMAEELVLGALLLNSASIPRAAWDLILLDDNDANLSNGTPHLAEITNAAALHRLYPFREFAYAQLNIGHAAKTVINKNTTPIFTIPGTASMTNFLPFGQYELSYASIQTPNNWIPIGSPGNTPVSNGTLANWNVTNISRGNYLLRLIVKSAVQHIEFQDIVIVGVEDGNLVTTVVTPTCSPHPLHLAVSTRGIAWLDTRHATREVYFFDFNTNSEQRLTVLPTNKYYIGTFDRYVTWVQGSEPLQVMLYDLNTNQQTAISPYGTRKEVVNISGSKIVWLEAPTSTSGFTEVHLYDITTNSQQVLPLNNRAKFDVIIENNNVIVAEYAPNRITEEIILYDLNTQLSRTLVTGAVDEHFRYMTISGNKLAIQRFTSALRSDILLFDLVTNSVVNITNDEFEQSPPFISGNKIFYSHLAIEPTPVPSDLHTYDLTTSSVDEILVTPLREVPAAKLGNRIVWLELTNWTNPTATIKTAIVP